MAETDIALGIVSDLTIDFEFVPYSRSRSFKPNTKPLERNLNYRFTLKRAGREVLTGDYSMGCAHCPAYKRYANDAYFRGRGVEFECEQGLPASVTEQTVYFGLPKRAIRPKLDDVMYSLIQDGTGALEMPFKDWALEYGYSDDSISARETYDACLAHGLALLRAFGQDALNKLRDAFQDY